MRGVAGILFLSVGFLVAYLVLSGKFPTSGSLVTTPAASGGEPAQGNNTQQQGNIIANKNIGSGPGVLGLPTMSAMHDLVASRGGMQ